MNKFLIGIFALAASATVCQAQTEFRHISFDEARTAAKAEGKQIFIDFFTDWCGPCKRLAKVTFPDKNVGDYLNSNFVCIKVDAEKGEGPQLAKKYGVKAYPTLCVISPEGTLVGSFAGAKEGADFTEAVQAISKPELNQKTVTEKYESGVRTPEIVKTYVFFLLENSTDYMASYAKAREVYEEYFNSLSNSDKRKKENQFLYFDNSYSYDTPRGTFLLSNLDMFDETDKAKAEERVKTLFQQSAIDYFTSNKLKGNKEASAAFSKFKKDAVKRGFGNLFKNMFEFTEKRASSDDKAYALFLDQNFERLTDEEQQYLCTRVQNLLPSETPEQKRAISAIIRNHIGKMTTGGVYNAARAIYQLEN